jgi:hypothetical protein
MLQKNNHSAAWYVAQTPLPRAIQGVKGAMQPGRIIAQKGRNRGAMKIANPVPKRARKKTQRKIQLTN